MQIINNTQVQQAFSVFNPEHNPDFPIHTPPRTPRVLRTSSVRALLRRLLSTQAIDQEFRETLEKACFRTDVIRLDCDVGPLLSFVLTADRGTGPPILQTHPRIPHSLEIRPQIYKYAPVRVCKAVLD
ncbi:hypothetical protein FOWG_02342 [Fusarium oxysporum f. sp. lycopersici MN25]|nr:hypothetical protein FOWG_02342 [Fusarium oxysporum f. sp. lycopersici MN25]